MSGFGERLAKIEVHMERTATVLTKLEDGTLPVCRMHGDAIGELRQVLNQQNGNGAKWYSLEYYKGKFRAGGLVALLIGAALSWGVYQTVASRNAAAAATRKVEQQEAARVATVVEIVAAKLAEKTEKSQEQLLARFAEIEARLPNDNPNNR